MLLEELQGALELDFWKVDNGLPVVSGEGLPQVVPQIIDHTVRSWRRHFHFKCLSGYPQGDMVSTDIFGNNGPCSDHGVFAYSRPGKQCRMIGNSGSVTDPGHEVRDLFYIVNVV